ncbi:flagellar biosynthesis protein FlhF [bacterium]|nr:flagellar biosynthesis protein FlhF [bacterium]
MTNTHSTAKPATRRRSSQIKSFRAPSMELAMEQIHKVFGIDAQILDSKEHVEKGKYPWSKSEGHVIVKARAAACAVAQTPKPSFTAGSQSNLRLDTREPGMTQIKRQPLSVTMQMEDQTPQPESPEEPPIAEETTVETKLQQPEVETKPEPADEVVQPTVEQTIDTVADNEAEQLIVQRFEQFQSELLNSEVDADTTTDILTSLMKQADHTQLEDDAAANGLLAAIVESRIDIANPIQLLEKRQVIACVGPSGSGKTTTLVKLASHFAIREAASVAFISFDTFRIAATEQLRTYANIIEAPIYVVTNLIDMRRAIADTEDCDFVFIDTAALNLNDELRVQELKQLLTEAGAERILLCVSATSSKRSLQRCGVHFQTLGTDSIVVTKTDEVDGHGTILTAIGATTLPVAYTTDGQNVPADIEPANGTAIAGSIIGRQTNTTQPAADFDVISPTD